jgi:DNA primase
MRFSPQLLDEIRARLPVSQVVSRHVRLKRAGREFIGLSPFKHEKTPSFTVNDQKGFYHCFATGEHGDIFTFLMKVEGVNFAEAVEKCATEAGVELPKPNEAEQRQEDRSKRLRDIVEASCRFFAAMLQNPVGQQAKGYLQRRGLDDSGIGRFRLGYAPAGRDVLKRHLLGQGFAIDDIVASGMCIGGADIAVPYDRFRDRVMFPIEDMKGQVIAFGGRALAADQKAKYLNSPETPLFHKGHLLYNMAKARRAAFDHGTVVVVEGYMDVIACAEAGFEYTVAPLGTALTEDQLRLLWRLAPEPVLCFDGDAAGRKAADRAIGIALPLLAPGHSLRFAFLPDGPDPDDLIRSDGPAALKSVLDAARPLAEVLWQRELSLAPTDTPERRAAFEARLQAEVAKIDNAAVRSHYEKDVRSRLWELWKDAGRNRAAARAEPPRVRGAGGDNLGWRRGGPWREAPAPISEALRQSTVVMSARGGASPSELLMLRAVLTHPWLLDDHAEDLAELTFSRRDFSDLRDAILRAQVNRSRQNGLDSEELHGHLIETGFGDMLDRLGPTRTYFPRWARRADSDRVTVEENWRHTVGLYRAEHEMQTELDGAKQDLCQEISEENFARVRNLNTHYQYSEFKNAGPGGDDGDDSLDDFLAMKLEQHGLKRPDR